jgi:hypothetical protein
MVVPVVRPFGALATSTATCGWLGTHEALASVFFPKHLKSTTSRTTT